MGVDPDAALTARTVAPAAVLFSVGWALAVTYHVLGNPRLASPVAQVVLAVAVVAVLRWPARPIPMIGLSVTVLAAVWSEAPLLGNHWLLHGFVAAGWLGATVAGRDRSINGIWPRFVPTAMLTLLGFYAFAAFAKLNAGFFDPTQSCAVVYFRESANSFGNSHLVGAISPALGRAIATGTAVTELSIPFLLVLRRTRRFGVLLAIAFHFVLALDGTHQFFDFSSILTVLFLLFVPGFASWVEPRWARVGVRLGDRRDLLHFAGALVAGGLIVVAASSRTPSTADFLKNVGLISFWAIAFLAIAGLVAYLRATSAADEPGLPPVPATLLVIPALVVLNGLTPYLELKTAYGWNMYANLRTVDGDSNHFLIRSTLPLTDVQDHLVEVLFSDDPGLQYYADNQYLLPEERFRDYLARHPSAGAVVLIDGHSETILPGEGGKALPEWRRKLLLFRAVDHSGDERCLTSFGPAQ